MSGRASCWMLADAEVEVSGGGWRACSTTAVHCQQRQRHNETSAASEMQSSPQIKAPVALKVADYDSCPCKANTP
jgi:hypothetical protein